MEMWYYIIAGVLLILKIIALAWCIIRQRARRQAQLRAIESVQSQPQQLNQYAPQGPPGPPPYPYQQQQYHHQPASGHVQPDCPLPPGYSYPPTAWTAPPVLNPSAAPPPSYEETIANNEVYKKADI